MAVFTQDRKCLFVVVIDAVGPSEQIMEATENVVMAALMTLIAFVFAILLGYLATLYFQLRKDSLNTESQLQQQVSQVKQEAQSQLARYQSISDLEKYKADLEGKVNHSRSLLPDLESLVQLEQYKAQVKVSVAEFQKRDQQWREYAAAQKTKLDELTAQVEAVEETRNMQSFGFYTPKYEFEDSEGYSHRLTEVRGNQKDLVKSEKATHCPQTWMVEGSEAKGRKMIKEHAKLMLRAFNGECDASIGKVKYNNVTNLENRINRDGNRI